jgi:transcriptional regulator with XRE-family HTH domain
MASPPPPVGDLLRAWRQRRRLSQLDLALEAEISTKHLSFLETGRSVPSRDMVLRLAEHLGIPLRERNQLLLAAGYAPLFSQHAFGAPALAPARQAVERLLQAHEPYPALAIDRHWTLLAANRAVPPLLEGVAPNLLASPCNVLRLSLHPDGLAPRIANLSEWRGHLLDRLRRQIDQSGDPDLAALERELVALPVPAGDGRPPPPLDAAGLIVPLRLRAGEVVLSFISTTTVFGTPVDVTLSELALETFFPADAATQAALTRLAAEPA